MQRAVIGVALSKDQDILVIEADPPQADWPEPRSAAALLDALRRWSPDVVVLPAQPSDVRRLVGDLRGAAVLVSTDGRSALGYDGDVSPGALVHMIRSVAGHASRN